MLTSITIAAAMALASYERHSVATNTETIVFEVADVLLDIPDFVPPDFNPPGFGFHQDPPLRIRQPTDRDTKAKILGFLWMEYPEARSISVWDGLAIVKLPRHEEPPISLHRGLFGTYVEPAKKSKIFGDK